jgi:hypothetical protein
MITVKTVWKLKEKRKLIFHVLFITHVHYANCLIVILKLQTRLSCVRNIENIRENVVNYHDNSTIFTY